MPFSTGRNIFRIQIRAALVVFVLSVFASHRLTMAAGEPVVPASWKAVQQEVATMVAACQYESAIAKLSEFIEANPMFGPAYERRAWVTLDWLDLRDDIALADVPLRNRAMADPAIGLGNIIPSLESRRVFIQDWYRERYVPPTELKSVQQDFASCRRLMGKDFNDKQMEAFIAEFVGNLSRAQELLGSRCDDGTATPREYLIHSHFQRMKGDLDGAMVDVQKGWKSPETRSQAGFRAINILRIMKRNKEAQAFMDRWQEATPRDARMMFVRIGNAPNPESIFNDFHALCELIPSEPGFHYGLATREMQFHKDAETSMVELNRAIELKTRSLLPYYARSCLWAKQNDAEAALADATAAIERCPYFDMSYQLRAKALRRLGDTEGARRDDRRQAWLKMLYDLYSKYRMNPKDEEAAYQLGLHCVQGEEWTRALRYLTACLKIESKHENALRQRCQVYLATGKLEPALADAALMVAIAPEPGSYALRGDVYARRKEWDKAVKDYERGNCLDDRLEQALRQRAAWHSAAGRVEPAKADMERANRVSPASFTTP